MKMMKGCSPAHCINSLLNWLCAVEGGRQGRLMLVFDLLNVGNITDPSPFAMGIQHTSKVENPPAPEGSIIPETVFEGISAERDPYLEGDVPFVLKHMPTDWVYTECSDANVGNLNSKANLFELNFFE